MQASNRILRSHPNLLKIIKVFGLVSIALVIFFSFFNDRRANNTGQDEDFSPWVALARIISAMFGDQLWPRSQKDAGMQIFSKQDILAWRWRSKLVWFLFSTLGKDWSLYLPRIL